MQAQERTDSSSGAPRPCVVADGPLDETVLGFMANRVELLPWDTAQATPKTVEGIYTYGHPLVDGAMLDRFPALKVVSNYGVGVDHIRVADAAARGISVGNTPGILDATTADMGFALLLASARLVVRGDRYARSAEFLHYYPGLMLGREVHGSTLGIIGLGSIGSQVARRARAFDMKVIYYNRTRREAAERELGAVYAPFETLLAQSDYVMLCCPLTPQTTGMIGAEQFRRMKTTATLVNIARGAVVKTGDLCEALQKGEIAAAALDVTEPEPLPRDHPLLQLENLTIVPHLGSATIETRREMARISVENLMAGLAGGPLLHEVGK